MHTLAVSQSAVSMSGNCSMSAAAGVVGAADEVVAERVLVHDDDLELAGLQVGAGEGERLPPHRVVPSPAAPSVTPRPYVFREFHRPDATDAPGHEGESNPFAAQLMEVMELLHGNLEAKSRLYKDLALSSIFLMNNGRYMLQKIRGSPEINAVVGEAWARKRSTDLRQYHKNYQRETWGRVLNVLRDDGVITVKGHVQKLVLKERFKQFNAAMDEIQRTQGFRI